MIGKSLGGGVDEVKDLTNSLTLRHRIKGEMKVIEK